LLSVLDKSTNPFTAKLLAELAGILFEPYGIQDAEMFLSSVDPNIVTGIVNLDEEYPFLIATMHDIPKAQKSIAPGLKPVQPTYWRDDENELFATFHDNRILIGSERAISTLTSHGAEPPLSTDMLTKLGQSKTPITTVGYDRLMAGQVAGVLSEISSKSRSDANYFTETRFTKAGIDRRTVSDFGLIGSIIAQLGQD
jgi:hypothetical protein